MLQTLASAIISLAVILTAVNVPVYWLSVSNWVGSDNLGATVTNLTGTENLTDFPTSYNANINNLNTDLEATIATTSMAGLTTAANLATVGTIGTGVWQATDVGVAHGGTGKSSWTQYLIPYADTTTSFSQIAIGTSGQVLTSNGAGSAPTFQASGISESANYNFTGSYFGATNLFASTTFSTVLSLASATSSSILKTDSTGKVVAASASTDYQAQRLTFVDTDNISATNGSATTSPVWLIPAGTITASSTIKITGFLRAIDSGTDGACRIALYADNVQMHNNTYLSPTLNDTFRGGFDLIVRFNDSVSSQTNLYKSVLVQNVDNGSGIVGEGQEGESTSSIDFSTAKSLEIEMGSNTTGASCDLRHVYVEVNP